MADTKISALPALSSPTAADEIPINDGGVTRKMTLAQVDAYVGPLRNAATTAQALATTATVVTASRIVLPQTRMQAGVVYRARIVLTKTAAATASPILEVRTGTTGTSSDTSRLLYTSVAQTAVADTGFLEVQCTFRSVGASAILASWLRFDHDLAATGFANATRGFQTSNVSSAFDTTTSGMGIEVVLTPGASAAWTVQQCYAELVNLAN